MLREQTNSNPANTNQANSNPANTRTTSRRQGGQNRIKEEKSFSLLFSVFMPGIFAFFLLYLLLSPGLNLTSQAETGGTMFFLPRRRITAVGYKREFPRGGIIFWMARCRQAGSFGRENGIFYMPTEPWRRNSGSGISMWERTELHLSIKNLRTAGNFQETDPIY